jgi:hypothetical protein
VVLIVPRWGGLFLGAKRRRCEADHSPPSTPEFKNNLPPHTTGKNHRGLPKARFPEINHPEREADNALPSSAEVNNGPQPPHARTKYLLGGYCTGGSFTGE